MKRIKIDEGQFLHDVGMSLRDYFAANAPIANFIAPAWTSDLENIEKNAEFAYRWADAMLRAKNI